MAHYYSIDGEAHHFVPMKTRPGELRPTRVTDAKKNGWIPSVTTIMDVLSKPALINWKIDQHLLQAFDMPHGLEIDEYLTEVKLRTQMEMEKAPSAGSDVHNILEDWFLGKGCPDEYGELCENVSKTITEVTGTSIGDFIPEKRFTHPLGFAGMCDLHSQKWVIDYKTKQSKDKFKPGKMAYPDHYRQLAAYREGLGIPDAQCANVFICIESGEIDFHLHKESDLQKGWGTFNDALSIWKRENFDSSWVRE